MEKFVYNFNENITDHKLSSLDLLGGKGANLAQMYKLGIPVPPGFTITTETCQYYYKNNKNLPENLVEQVSKALEEIEKQLDSKLGDTTKPLLVSVRSGARASMPGMMDTILNLGLNDKTVEALAIQSNDYRFAYDSYRRFIQMYSDVVLGVESYHFEEIIYATKQQKQIVLDTDLNTQDLQKIITQFKDKVQFETGQVFPQDTKEQLWAAIKAVFTSWMNKRAITYRKLNNVPESWGTAVNVQAMVFGNKGETSVTGVAFTRNPSTGKKEYYGEYLPNAQGEDVVAGIRTPKPLTINNKLSIVSQDISLEEFMPEAFKQLSSLMNKLEIYYKDMQDIEFTIEQGKLWILQTRSGKRTTNSAVKIAVDLVEEGAITEQQALLRIDANSVDQLLHPTLDVDSGYQVIAKGLPASPGAASGRVVFSADDAEQQANKGNVILVRIETSPEDIAGMHAASGILTTRGGMTSHAAVVARGMGKCCVSGAGELNINYQAKNFIIGEYLIKEGDIITLNGSTGEVILGEVPTLQPQFSLEFKTLLNWANKYKKLKVRANADNTRDSEMSIKFGAEGIGLCRTEHMFFDQYRINAVREMILARDSQERTKALEKLLPMQVNDFVEIFSIMKNLPVNIRLLDPPLHEFLPHTPEDVIHIAQQTGLTTEKVQQRANQLKEHNPMLGHRGCRLGITYPEIYQMQVRAIFQAMKIVGSDVTIAEIMVPLIMDVKELDIIKVMIQQIADEIMQKENIKLNYTIGTMIELPRAALLSDEIAKSADFFSFGTNDLTQTTLGISRDDSSSFLGEYQNRRVITNDPFAVLDQEGVGQLITISLEKGRKTNPNLKIGICGEHGGEPVSIEFFHKAGLDYVSCSPYRVPVAIIAAARAALKN